MHNRQTKNSRSSAFTLLEVILALAILAGAVAVLSEVMSIASRSATDAQAESEAQLLAVSVMDEMLAGALPLTMQTKQPLETDAAIPWVYSVTLSETKLAGLTSVEVLVEQDTEQQFRPVRYRLVRWFASDSVESEAAPEATESAATGDAESA